jgi:hypothetical protein
LINHKNAFCLLGFIAIRKGDKFMRKYVLTFLVIMISVVVSLSQTTGYNNSSRSATKNPTSKAKSKTTNPKPPTNSNGLRRGEFYIGYSGTVAPVTAGGPIVGNEKSTFHGVQTSVTIPANRFVGLRGDFSVTYNDRDEAFSVGGPPTTVTRRTSIYNILGGVQFKDYESESAIQPFGHALIGLGVYHQSLRNCQNPLNGSYCGTAVKDHGLAGAFGGGLDFRVASRAGIRLTSDYNPMRIDGETLNNFRFGVGVVFK